ncbi:S-layer family protein [Leptolyngbya boryana CZ1]|uniref:S-layer family protein n=1 Tax=Leptolyngbya boryana CZ1 TaxID=3060204 RepID=A0AA96WW32_LEPBY|nr:S-layer family protein [Leptolyngbya boryana]WNZ45244.1 S-layer family protein [Leptolyngbya boryana CZ1]
MLRLLISLGLFGSWLLSARQAHAQQITPDDTLGSAVARSGNDFTITNGSTAGNNLFHSFREFSIPTGGSAFFDNATSVQNIFSRVTGGTVSNLDGILRANGTANVFLLNPNGILFGPNAQMNLGGSFTGTTASVIKFADGTEFNAASPNSAPLLTLSVPIGLQFGSQAAPIQNQSKLGLQVKPERTLNLLGGDVLFSGGSAIAPSGLIHLGSVAPTSFVGLVANPFGWSLNYDQVQNFQNIHLTQAARLNVSGARGVGVQIQGRQVTLRDGSAVTANISGTEAGQGITVKASESLEVIGMHANGKTPTNLTTSVLANAQGQGGEILIETPTLRLLDAGLIATRTYGRGNGGNLNVRANSVEIRGRDLSESNNSELITQVEQGAKGRGGNLTLEAQSVAILDGASIKLRTRGSGHSGDLLIRTTDLVLAGRAKKGSGTDVSTNSRAEATGNGGTLTIEATRIRLSDSASIRAKTFGAGAAGTIVVRAQDMTVNDSRLTTESDEFATGDGGDMHLNVGSLRFTQGGHAVASTLSSGDAGSIFIAARSLELSGQSPETTPASLRSPNNSNLQAFSAAQGHAGRIQITTETLRVTDDAKILVSGQSSGDAGNLSIRANMITLDTAAQFLAEANAGSQGNIDLNAQVLLMRHGSRITASAYKQSNGGNIRIIAPIIVGIENSDIIANAKQGQGGNIQITTQELIGLQYRNRITPENDITASSEVSGLEGTVEVNTVGVDPNSGLIQLPADIIDPTQQIAADCAPNQSSSFVITGRGGVPINPMQDTRRDLPWNDVRDLAHFPTRTVNAKRNVEEILQPTALMEATTWYRNSKTGKVELVAAQPAKTSSTATCAAKY